MPKVTVQIDPSVCILAANCVGIEPKLFQIGQEAYVELVDANGISHGTEYTIRGQSGRAGDDRRSCRVLSDASHRHANWNLNPA